MTSFNRRLPPLNTLVVFEAAYRLQSFSRAADEVFLSQASVSRQIKQLESNLGVALFRRQRHDVMPTEQGDMLASSVYLTLTELALTAENLRQSGNNANRLTIFSDISLGRHLIAPYLDDFRRQFPEVKIRLISTYEPIDTFSDDFDIGFQVGRWAQDRFEIDAIADDAVFPVCSPEFASGLPKDIDPAALSSLPLLHLEDVGRDWIDWKNFLAHFRVRNPAVQDGLLFTSYQVCLDAAEKNEGIALGWYRTVKPQLDDGKLVRIPSMTIHIPESINVYRRKLAEPNPIVDRFIEKIKSSIEPIE